MLVHPIARILPGRLFLRTIKGAINIFVGNVRFDISSNDPFIKHFPGKNKMKIYIGDDITLSVHLVGVEVHRGRRWSVVTLVVDR